MKFWDYVLELCEQIIWVVICQDHVISRSCDHDITSSELTRAGAGIKMRVGIWASRIALKICCKSFLEYLGISVAVIGATMTGDFYLWEFSGLFEKFWLGEWRRVKKRDGKTLLTRTIMVSDWSLFGADFFLKYSSKRAGWPIGYWKIRIVKRRLFVIDLVMCYSRNAYCN